MTGTATRKTSAPFSAPHPRSKTAAGGGAKLRNLASGKVLANPQGSHENGVEMIQWDDTGDTDQAWSLEPGPHGGLRLRNMASHKLLANPQGSRNNGTTMIQWEDTGETDQEWLFDPPIGQAR
jgi:hypothetical protein